jgi:MYXO-CTERM domain-containing protein
MASMRSFLHATRLRALLVLASAITLGAGCSDPNAGVGEPVAQTSLPLFGNDQTSFNYFVGKGLTAVQAAGIVGNLDQESGDTPTAVQAGGPGRGVAQWSTGGRWDTSANDNENWFVTNKDGGSSHIWDLSTQLDFIWYELTNFPGYGLADLQSQTTVSGATTAFMDKFEICGTCDATNRINYAQAVYDAYGTVPYAAAFVAQSFPYATMTMTMTEGQVVPSYIELKNTGTKSWDANTKIGTTGPRDRTSAFADNTWVAPNRPARVSGTVAPGGTFKFTFDLAAPMKTGLYDEHFGVVEEGVAWFSDPGQGGPPDTQLEVKIQVVAAPSSASSSSGSGGSTSGAGGASGAGGSGLGGSGATGSGGAAAGGSSTSTNSGGAVHSPNHSSGCSVSASGHGPTDRSGLWLLGFLAAAAQLARRRRSGR